MTQLHRRHQWSGRCLTLSLAVFWRKVHWSLDRGCWPAPWEKITTAALLWKETNTWWVKVLFFGLNCEEESVGQTQTVTDFSITAVFFSSYKTRPVTCFLMWRCIVGHSSVFCWVAACFVITLSALSLWSHWTGVQSDPTDTPRVLEGQASTYFTDSKLEIFHR